MSDVQAVPIVVDVSLLEQLMISLSALGVHNTHSSYSKSTSDNTESPVPPGNYRSRATPDGIYSRVKQLKNLQRDSPCDHSFTVDQ